MELRQRVTLLPVIRPSRLVGYNTADVGSDLLREIKVNMIEDLGI